MDSSAILSYGKPVVTNVTDRAAFDRAPFDAKEKLESCLFTPNQCPALPVAITILQASDV